MKCGARCHLHSVRLAECSEACWRDEAGALSLALCAFGGMLGGMLAG